MGKLKRFVDECCGMDSLMQTWDHQITINHKFALFHSLAQKILSILESFYTNQHCNCLGIMNSDDLSLTESALRCICSVFRHPSAPVDLIFSDNQLLVHLLTLTMQSVTNQICITTIFSCSCKVMVSR